ncbi:MAG: DNA polymerase III subunit gamma/tau, partial [Bacillota bacterium]|nr:DNA polymerase III subunit gamma/tau [Bacillota bacterium]
MSNHMALYRKWRPMTFDDVVGQEYVTKTLKNEVVTGKISHAFLFCGGRGTGKTSTARILSRALNCTSPENGNPCNKCETCKGILSGEILDIIEIVAASNNGVDNIRELRDEARFCAANAKYKVYIIDEVHMLSTGAFNALLKLLEEPPEGVIFILATTETHKVPLTILSRCQRFDFRRITTDDIASRLLYVAKQEGIKIDDESIRLVAKSSDGALRDALGFLEQLSALDSDIKPRDVYNLLGITEKTFLYQTTRAIALNDIKRALSMLDEYLSQGKNAANFIDSMTEYFRSLLMCQLTDAVFSEYTKEELEELCLASSEMSSSKLIYCIEILTKTASTLKYMTNDRVMLDVAIIKMCTPGYSQDPEAMDVRIAELERKIANGNLGSANTQESTPLETLPQEQSKTLQKKLEKIHKPTSEEFKRIEEKWPEICRATKNIKLMIALE